MSGSALDELKCPVCLEVAIDPVECSKCNRIFCELCSSVTDRCPICRAIPSYKPSALARRLTSNLPAKCQTCGLQLTRGTVKDHETVCRPMVCPAPNCDFKDSRDAFLRHLIERHRDIVTKNAHQLFETVVDPIAITRNNGGNVARLGLTGKYYCNGFLSGKCLCTELVNRLGLSPVNTCGPVNGCNCVSCMQLDLKSRRLPEGYLVNREGANARLGPNGIFYCGRFSKDLVDRGDCDGYCGPENGPNCDPCQELDVLKLTRYASLVNVPPSSPDVEISFITLKLSKK